MATAPVQHDAPRTRSTWRRIPLALMNLLLAAIALWLGMSVPSYFRSVSPLVLEAAADGTPGLLEMARRHLQGGRPGLAQPLLRMEQARPNPGPIQALLDAEAELLERFPDYRWSGGPAPFYEQFLQQARHLREDETAVIPTLLPREHRSRLLGFLRQSPNRNVHQILQSRDLGSWQSFYPVYSTSGQPLDATLLTIALLEQATAFTEELETELMSAVGLALAGSNGSVRKLEPLCIAVLTLGRHMDWVQLRTAVGAMETGQDLLFAAQALQEAPGRTDLILSGILYDVPFARLSAYLARHGDRGWASFRTAAGLGSGAVQALVEFDKPVYHPPAFWSLLPPVVHQGQERMKSFAESFPHTAILLRVFAFGMCGVFLVGTLRVLILGPRPPGGRERRLLINLDSLVGSVLVTLLVWVLIEPGLLDFRPNEQGTLQIKLAQPLPDDAASTIETAATTMLDQVTILVLLLFFVAQLLVFIFGLLKIAEIRRRPEPPETKLRLLDNEEVLFDLGLYVGLGGTVASLILVVLNIVDASLMAAYASTLFGIIFVAFLKIGFLRPFRRHLILRQS